MSSMQSLFFDLGSWLLALGSIFSCLLSVVSSQLSEKGSKSQMSTELSFVFDPLS